MSERWDMMIAARTYKDRDGNEKTAWTKIGTMWAMDGNRFSLTFEALPLPQLKDGKIEVRAVCFPPKEREEKRDDRAPWED